MALLLKSYRQLKLTAVRFMILFQIILLLSTFCFGQNRQLKLGILTDRQTDLSNIVDAIKYPVTVNLNTQTLSFTGIKANPGSLNSLDVLWFHRTDSSEFSDIETHPVVVKAIKNYLENGGNLVLTLDALRYLIPLGIEIVEPQIRYVTASDQGYGRNLGLHAFRSHPVFDGLHGGAYIFNPTTDYQCRQVGYFDSSVPEKGKVVAVDWAYITLKQDSKLMLEYQVGKGRVLAIGAYTLFEPENKNRSHLEKFVLNCITYLSESDGTKKTYYWNYDPVQIIEEKNQTDCADKVEYSSSKNWPESNNPMALRARFAGENAWDIAGRQIVLMGKEKGGISEAWAHPFMAFRDYEVGIRFSYQDTVFWLNNERPSVEVLPESFRRIYKFRRAYLTEVISVGQNDPCGIIHYEYRGVYPAKLIIKYKSNFRFMWPYPAGVLGSLSYSWDENLNGFCIRNESGEFALIMGSNKKPDLKLAGNYSDFIQKDTMFTGQTAEEPIAGFLMRYPLKMNDNLDIVFSAGSEGIKKTVKRYAAALKSPESIYRAAADTMQSVLGRSLMIESPDEAFNLGYRWAVAGTDRFFVNTPDLGTALVAGYATTAKGWDGGHAVNGRPGYAWYFGRDAQWSGFAVLDYGDFENVREQLEFFNRFQDISGKIFHELTTSGAVHYDAADATPLYVILAAKYLRHSGDFQFIERTWPNITAAMDYCFSTDTDHDHLIENTAVGHGWIEGGKLYGAHTTLYLASCWAEALEQAARMAELTGKTEQAEHYANESQIVKNIIKGKFWNPGISFFNYGLMKDGTFISEPTVLAAIPIYFEQADKTMAEPVVAKFAGNGFTADWGVRILSKESTLFNPRSYHGGTVWPLFTGWASLAEYRYGNAVQGFSHIMNNLQICKDWSLGYLEEVLNGSEYTPAGVCAHQCWSETMVLQPVIEGMLGLKPEALHNTLSLSPALPANWDTLKVSNIRIGAHRIDMRLVRCGDNTTFTFKKQSPGLVKIEFSPVFPAGTNFNEVRIDKRKQKIKSTNFADSKKLKLAFNLEVESQVEISHSGGVAVLPVFANPGPGYLSEGMRIISIKLNGSQLHVRVHGQTGHFEQMQIYAPGRQIRQISGGEFKDSDGKIHRIEIPFEGNEAGYAEKTIVVTFSEVL